MSGISRAFVLWWKIHEWYNAVTAWTRFLVTRNSHSYSQCPNLIPNDPYFSKLIRYADHYDAGTMMPPFLKNYIRKDSHERTTPYLSANSFWIMECSPPPSSALLTGRNAISRYYTIIGILQLTMKIRFWIERPHDTCHNSNPGTDWGAKKIIYIALLFLPIVQVGCWDPKSRSSSYTARPTTTFHLRIMRNP